jgi:flagellar hook protein FlgE
MALDGGSSSQLYAKAGKFELDLQGIARVTNGIVVTGK